MAVFNDLLDLRTAVIEAVGKPEIADVFPRLVGLAEGAIGRDLRTRDMVEQITLPFVSGEAPMPDDVAEIIGLYSADGYEYVAQPLHQVKPSGTTYYYAINASNILVNGFDGDLTLEYYAKITPLEAMTDRNWLLDKYPEVYLHGVSLQAAKYLRDIEAAKVYKELYGMALDDARGDDFRQRYARARVRVQGVTP